MHIDNPIIYCGWCQNKPNNDIIFLLSDSNDDVCHVVDLFYTMSFFFLQL